MIFRLPKLMYHNHLELVPNIWVQNGVIRFFCVGHELFSIKKCSYFIYIKYKFII